MCLCSTRRNFTDPQYPNHAKTSRQVPPSHYGLAPAGLPDGPDVPGGSRWPRVSGACTGAQAASSKYSQRMSLASLCPAQTSPLGWRSRRRLPLPASLPLPPLLNCRKQLELGHGLFRRPCSPWTLRLPPPPPSPLPAANLPGSFASPLYFPTSTTPTPSSPRLSTHFLRS